MTSVFSPVTGTITSTNCYCDCLGGCNTVEQCQDSSCKHNASDYWLKVWPGPQDIGALQGTQLYFSASSFVLSIKFVRVRICQALGYEDATEALEIQMYNQPNAGGSSLGRVPYGHVNNRPQDGEVRNISDYTTGTPCRQ